MAILFVWFLQKAGVALPVAQSERLLAGCAGRLILRREEGLLPLHHFDLRDREVELSGEYGTPFVDGRFSVGLAAALIRGGARRKKTNPQDNPSITLDKAAELAV